MAVLAHLHYAQIGTILASDVDETALALAKRNLNLVTMEGVNGRLAELQQHYQTYGKSSHAEAIDSAQRLSTTLTKNVCRHQIETDCFLANGLVGMEMAAGLNGRLPDIVLADVPYGSLTNWHTTQQDTPLID